MGDVIVRGGLFSLTHFLTIVWPIREESNFKGIMEEFPPMCSLYKIFNKNNVKSSCSCMPKVANLINKSNTKKLMNKQRKKPPKCNCINQTNFPLRSKGQ